MHSVNQIRPDISLLKIAERGFPSLIKKMASQFFSRIRPDLF